MKKIVIFFALIAGIAAVGFAQSLQLSNGKGILPSNGEIIQAGTPDSSELVTYIYVKNTGTTDKNVVCKKTQMMALDSTEVTMCWAGGCYPSTTNISPNAQLITPGQTNYEFLGHYTQINWQHLYSKSETALMAVTRC